jgi:hypothetical protein
MTEIINLPQTLRIIKGVSAAPGDTETAELGYTEIISLLGTAGQDGYFLDPEQNWQPAYPQLKGGGVYAQSPVVDGRTLVAAADDDVLETFNILVKASSWLAHATLMSRLFRLRDDASLFHTSETQVEPVFIEYRHSAAKAPQYALIKTMEVASNEVDYPDANQIAVTRVTLRVMRVGGWHAVVPIGGNPRLYKFWKLGWVFGQDYTLDDLRLCQETAGEDDSTYSAIDEEVDNRFEWTGGGTSHESYLSKNWIDIPADEIPGDLEADAYISVIPSGDSPSNFVKFWVGRYTRPTTYRGRASDENFLAYNILPAGDGVAAFGGGSGTAAVDACGVYCRDDAANQYIVEYTAPVAAGTWQNVLQWYPNNQPMNIASWRGTWAAFLRCQQINGAQDDMQARLVIEQGYALGYGGRVTLDPQVMPYWSPLASCVEFPVMYLGQFTLPLDNEHLQGGFGRGAEIRDDGGDAVWLSVETLNTKTATRDLEFLDLILMPMSEVFGCFTAENSILGHVSANSFNIMDTTGYAMHGKEGMYASVNGGNETPYWFMPIEWRGPALRLKPGVNNRLYFLFQHYSAGGGPAENISLASAQCTVRVAVVPRYSGIIDVEQD